jgi:hypothetical protein
MEENNERIIDIIHVEWMRKFCSQKKKGLSHWRINSYHSATRVEIHVNSQGIALRWFRQQLHIIKYNKIFRHFLFVICGIFFQSFVFFWTTTKNVGDKLDDKWLEFFHLFYLFVCWSSLPLARFTSNSLPSCPTFFRETYFVISSP